MMDGKAWPGTLRDYLISIARDETEINVSFHILSHASDDELWDAICAELKNVQVVARAPGMIDYL